MADAICSWVDCQDQATGRGYCAKHRTRAYYHGIIVPKADHSIIQGETWRPVMGYEGVYEVSDQGRVRRIGSGRGVVNGAILRYAKNLDGYRYVTLTVHRKARRVAVHRLVLEAFVSPRPEGLECNHKDGDKANNHPSNLEWVTGQANMQHAYRMGLVTTPTGGHGGLKGERNGRAKLTAEQVAEIRRLPEAIPNRITAVRYGVSKSLIGQIRSGRVWADP